MITKYKGSLTKFTECEKIALVHTRYSLIESKIDDYKLDSKAFTLIALLNRSENSNHQFIYSYSGWSKDFVFDAVIMYTAELVPIGFTMLNYEVDTKKYGIKIIDINLDFSLSQNERFIDIDINTDYTQHALNTPNVHKNLLGEIAIKKSSTEGRASHQSSYTNILGMKDKVFRYSGELMRNEERFINNPFVDIPWLGTLSESIRIDNKDYLLTAKNSSLILASSTEYKEFEFPSDVKLLGSNMIIADKMYSTKELIKGRLIPINEIPEGIRYVKNLITKELYVYHLEDDLIIPDSIELIEIIDRLKVNDLSGVTELLAVGPNLLIYRVFNDSNSIKIKTDSLINQRRLITDSLMFYRPKGDNKKSMTYNNGQEQSMRYKRYTERIEPSNDAIEYEFGVSDIVAVSNKCLIVKRTSNQQWYTIEVRPSTIANKLKSYNLGTVNNWRRIDKFAHTRVNPLNLEILFTPNNGRLYKVSRADGVVKVEVL